MTHLKWCAAWRSPVLVLLKQGRLSCCASRSSLSVLSRALSAVLVLFANEAIADLSGLSCSQLMLGGRLQQSAAALNGPLAPASAVANALSPPLHQRGGERHNGLLLERAARHVSAAAHSAGVSGVPGLCILLCGYAALGAGAALRGLGQTASPATLRCCARCLASAAASGHRPLLPIDDAVPAQWLLVLLVGLGSPWERVVAHWCGSWLGMQSCRESSHPTQPPQTPLPAQSVRFLETAGRPSCGVPGCGDLSHTPWAQWRS